MPASWLVLGQCAEALGRAVRSSPRCLYRRKPTAGVAGLLVVPNRDPEIAQFLRCGGDMKTVKLEPVATSPLSDVLSVATPPHNVP